MASPHVAGLAALVISRFGDSSSPQNGKMRPGQVSSLIQQTADGQPCPDTLHGLSARDVERRAAAVQRRCGLQLVVRQGAS